MRVPPTCDTAVQPVEDEGGRRERRSGEEVGRRVAAHIKHGAQNRRHSACRIGQREHIGQMKLADHGKMLGTKSRHEKTVRGIARNVHSYPPPSFLDPSAAATGRSRSKDSNAACVGSWKIYRNNSVPCCRWSR